MHKKVIATVLSVAIATSCSASMVVFADTLQEQLQQQKKELAEHENDFQEAQKIVEELNSKIEELDYNIEETLNKIDELNNKITDIEKNIENAKQEIEQAQIDMEAEKKLYEQRMSAMYMNGETGYVEIVLGAKNLSDLFSRIQIVRTITELDKEIIATLKAKQAEVEASKKLMEQENAELAATKGEQQNKMSELQVAKDEQQKYIDEAQKEATAYANVVNKDKAEIDKTNELIEQARAATQKYTPSRGSAEISSNAIVAYASNYLGRPYQWGATGPNSFDCSGFTSYVFDHFGVNLPRVSRSQAGVGSYVDKSDLQPGDLVFFGSPIRHVGIYVGNNCYIHSPQTGDVVKISTLSSRSDFVTARRVY
ncbi:C40 family peptidase [Clostridium grantii]|uniref:Cell wall-associated hydrolase, NlpC family n=1 Tax=Clostridium grantii DSM 8605 TaxID=1121316 RepID=A0A1M5XQN1_9CLOT|nr:C40 family peptidase [Clostridium grantii]SHI02155.1 Cell wall-associated hydrolase, NlpC family [Clostridium grantii DSM 8605]